MNADVSETIKDGELGFQIPYIEIAGRVRISISLFCFGPFS